MDILVIAQLITGIATLMVASVLIWQMIIQKRTLDIAHNDADSSMSLSSVENKLNLNTWFSENSTVEMNEKMEKGLDYLNSKEKELVRSYIRGHLVLLVTEWRLGRMNQNPLYFKQSLIMILRNKATLDVVKETRDGQRGTVAGDGFIRILEETYETLSGEKLPSIQ